MSLANIQNLPSREKDIWAFSHMDSHRLIIRRIRELFGIRLNEYPLDPMPDDLTGWNRLHQTMHNEMTSILGLNGFDLTGLDLEDDRTTEAWTFLNFTEHENASQLLGI